MSTPRVATRTFSIIAMALVFVLRASPTLAIGYTNGPVRPGNSGVLRVGDTFGFFVVDAANDLTSFHGTSTLVADFCAGVAPVPDVFDLQLVALPSGALNFLFGTAEHHVQIYPSAPPGCPSWSNLPLLYSGTARMIRTDNDVIVGGPSANAFGWQATGTLTDHVHGGTVQYTEVVRLVVSPKADPNDPNAVRELVVDIRVR